MVYAGKRILKRCRWGEVREGFTLFEVMIAFSVITIVAFGVLSGLASGYSADREGTETIRAQNVARRAMERLMAEPFNNLSGLDNTLYTEDGSTPYVDGNLQAFIRVQQIGTGIVGLCRLQVVVRAVGDARDIVKVVTLRSPRRTGNA